ncbi:MAG TPA: heme biosynthesis HemY N-terminal domain-containing protein [Pseudomonadales bacterium]
MIRVFLWLLLALSATWWVADVIKQHGPGYVLLYYNHYSVETSVWVAMLLLFALVLLFYLSIRLLHNISRLALLARRQSVQRRLRHHRNSVQALLEQDYSAAVTEAGRVAHSRSQDAQPLLLAARAALDAGVPETASQYLQQALQLDQPPQPLLTLLRYDTLLASGQLQQAGQLLDSLLRSDGRHIAVLQRAVTAFVTAGRHDELRSLLPALSRKVPPLHVPLQRHLLLQAARCLLQQAQETGSAQAVRMVWKSFSRTIAHDPVLPWYGRALLACGERERAHKLLLRHLQAGFDKACLVPYALSVDDNDDQALAFLQDLHKRHGDSAELALARGILLLKNRQLDEARQALEHSLQLQPGAEAYRYLAAYHDRRNDEKHARQCLEKALQLAL